MSLNGFLCHSSCLLPSTYLYLSVPRPDAKLLCLIGTDVFFSLYHYYQDKYPQLSQHPSRDFEEMADFWDTHDVTDYEEYLTPVEVNVSTHPKHKSLSDTLDTT
jgi:hypothetical protein